LREQGDTYTEGTQGMKCCIVVPRIS